jgi:O-antigen/teichoic acid export membrane protein
MRPVATLLASNLFGAVVAGVFFLAASWSFDLTEVGRYALALTIQWCVAGLVGRALQVATVRLTVKALAGPDPTAAGGVALLAVMISAGLSLLAAGVSWGLGRFADAWLLPSGLLALVFLWAGARSVLDCLTGSLLARQQYSRAALLVVLTALISLATLVGILLGGPLTLGRLLGAHAFGMGSSAAAGLWFVRPGARGGVRPSRRQLGELLAYARWPALSEGLSLVQTDLGLVVVAVLAGAAQAGVFGVARYPAVVFGVVATSSYQYWLPTAARDVESGTPADFLARQMRLSGMVAVAMLLGALALRPALPWLGANFAAAAPLFVLNAIDFALLVLIKPVNAMYHGLLKPQLELIWRAGHLPVLAVGALLLVPRFGAAGMVWTQLVSTTLGAVLAVWLLWHELDTTTRRQALEALRRR